MTRRLSTDTIRDITSASLPRYERKSVKNGIVHLGIGGFHRAHQAVYTDELLASGDLSWGITGVSLRSSSVRDALAPQDFLYSVKTLGQDAPPPRIIGSVLSTLAIKTPTDRQRVLELLAHHSTQVISLTVTEKGYCATPSGELDTAHPDVAHDLTNPAAPRSVPGLLTAGLKLRMKNGGGPLSVLSCDNLSSNGKVIEGVVRGMAAQDRASLDSWLADQVSFPATMVDRIVPQTNAADITAFEQEVGYRDEALICGEAFSQWVIEDDFRGRRPDWDIFGAQFTTDVIPFEQAKLGLLNATHSALAYLGLLSGYTYVHEALANPDLRAFVTRMLNEEISPEVDCPKEMDINTYKADLLRRFADSAVPYRTAQVASDGSQKLPQRIYPTIAKRLEANKPTECLSLVVASWIECLSEHSAGGAPKTVSDPATATVAALAQAHSQPADLVQAIAVKTGYFGGLGSRSDFRATLVTALETLRTLGITTTLKKTNQGERV